MLFQNTSLNSHFLRFVLKFRFGYLVALDDHLKVRWLIPIIFQSIKSWGSLGELFRICRITKDDVLFLFLQNVDPLRKFDNCTHFGSSNFRHLLFYKCSPNLIHNFFFILRISIRLRPHIFYSICNLSFYRNGFPINTRLWNRWRIRLLNYLFSLTGWVIQVLWWRSQWFSWTRLIHLHPLRNKKSITTTSRFLLFGLFTQIIDLYLNEPLLVVNYLWFSGNNLLWFRSLLSCAGTLPTSLLHLIFDYNLLPLSW